jgi:hypothetical protein
MTDMNQGKYIFLYCEVWEFYFRKYTQTLWEVSPMMKGIMETQLWEVHVFGCLYR